MSSSRAPTKRSSPRSSSTARRSALLSSSSTTSSTCRRSRRRRARSPGTDLRAGVATLPLIHLRALAETDQDAAALLARIEAEAAEGTEGEASADFTAAISELRQHPVTTRTLTEAHRWAHEAVAALDPLPDGPVKQALRRRSSTAASKEPDADDQVETRDCRRRTRRDLRCRHPAQGRTQIRRVDRPLRPPACSVRLRLRHGVAPDHPRIKGIINALREVLDRGDIRVFGNVEFGTDITLEDLKRHYNAVIFATGAVRDAELNIPGIDLDGSYGAAEFVSWFDGHPDVPREWPLTAQSVAVIGNGNVALDVSRMLAKKADDLLSTEISEKRLPGLSDVSRDHVHALGRRGPAQVKFTPLELRQRRTE